MVTKMADKIGIKLRNCLFWLNSKDFGTEFLKVRTQHKLIPKKPFNMLCAIMMLIICENVFLVFACALC